MREEFDRLSEETEAILREVETASETEQPEAFAPQEAEGELYARPAKLHTALIVTATVVGILLVALVLMLLPGVRYSLANKLYEKENYALAESIFTTTLKYRDSRDKVLEIEEILAEQEAAEAYEKGLALQESGSYEEAEAAFEAAGQYLDAESRRAFCEAAQKSLTVTLYRDDTADRTVTFGPETLQLSYDEKTGEVSLNEASVLAALEELAEEVYTEKVDSSWTQEAEGAPVVVTVGIDGVELDTEALLRKLQAAVKALDFSGLNAGYNISACKKVGLATIRYKVCTDPVNAEYDPDTHSAKEGKVGYTFDEATVEAILAKTKPGESFTIPLTEVEPQYDKDDLDGVYFSTVIGEYKTTGLGSVGRTTNITLACEAVNGTILNPGETFSFNDVVGKRTLERGFQYAGAYAGGKSVQEVGGGICQVSTTIYNAALLANLEIVTRSEHCYPSAYCPLGLDATVSWGGPEFRFRNNTEYPIRIDAKVEDGWCIVQLIGTDDGVHVEMTYEVLDVRNYETKTTTDPEEVNEVGHTGYTVQSYRHVYSDATGELISTTKEAYSYYSTQDIVKLVEEEPEEETKKETNPIPDTEPADPEEEDEPIGEADPPQEATPVG